MKRLRSIVLLIAALICGLALLQPPAIAQSSSESPLTPWTNQTSGLGSTIWWTSPAAFAQNTAATTTALTGYTVVVAGFQGPYTTGPRFGFPCSVTQPCMQVDFWNVTLGFYGGGLFIQYYDTSSFGQVCADGLYSATGQSCPGKSRGSGLLASNSLSGCPLCAGRALPVGDPIDVGSGNVFEQATDYSTSGQNPLSFTRYYNSLSSLVTPATELGQFWRSNYDRYILIDTLLPNLALVERGDGRLLTFTISGSTWTTDADVDVTLTHSGSTWTFTDHDDTVETYSNVSPVEAQLTSIQLRNGYTQTLTYTSNQLSSVTDSYGRSLTFTYNTNGQISSVTTPDSTTINYGFTTVSNGADLTSVTFPTSPASTFTYVYANTSLPNALTSIVDENSNTFESWTYDAIGRGLTSQGGSGANLTTLTYNDTTGARTVTNALGVTDTYSFSTLQNVPKVTGISRAATSTTAAATETFAYDSNGYLNSQTDWNGGQTTYTNNAHGQPTTINEAVGSTVARTTTIAYDPTFVHLPGTITTPGLTTTNTYDGSGELLTKTLTDTTTQTVPYSTNGQTRTWTNTWSSSLLASSKTPNNNTTHYGYDSTGALTSITDPLTHATNVTSHTGGGLPLTVVDANGVTTTFTYDPRQRLLTRTVTTGSGARTTTNAYDAAEQLLQTTLPDSSFLAYAYDPAHRLTGITDADSSRIAFTLDALGDKTQTNTYNSSSTLERQHSATFDAFGRMLTDVGGVSQTTTYTYDKNGNALTIKDPLNHTTTRVFDALNRLSQSTDANAGVTKFAYDAHDRTLTVTDPLTDVTTNIVDGFGDLIQQTSPDSGKTVFHFDADANQTQKVDALSVTANATFDALDRIASRSYPADSTQNVSFTYDQTGTGFGFGIGQLTTVADPAGTLNRAYDEQGNLLAEKRTNGSTVTTTSYGYDPANRIASVTYPDGNLVTNTYDPAGYLAQVSAQPSGATTATTIGTITHLPFGPLNAVGYGNGVEEGWGFDSDYRPITVLDYDSSSNLRQALAYFYDAADNVKTILDDVTITNNATLTYDVLNRIKTASSGYGSFTWTYDAAGNVKTQKLGTVTTTYTYTTGSNKLKTVKVGSAAAVTVATNANGNITSIPPANSATSATFAYNVANRLASVTGSPMGATFTYDWQGQRFEKLSGGSSPNLFTYGQDNALLEESNSGSVTDYLYADGRPLATFSPATGTFDYINDDRLGTPQLVTDSSENNVWHTTYQPYGTPATIVSGIVQNLRLPGQYADLETGFSYNLNRDYMPNIGRYLETDPIGLAGGFNTYAYGNNNPLKYIDREGRNPLLIGAGIAVFSAGAYAGYINSPQHPYMGAVIGGSAAISALFAAPEAAAAYVDIAAAARLGTTARIVGGTFGAAAAVGTSTAGATAIINFLNDRPWDTGLRSAETIALGAGLTSLDLPVAGAIAVSGRIPEADLVFSSIGSAVLGTWATTIDALWQNFQHSTVTQGVNCPK